MRASPLPWLWLWLCWALLGSSLSLSPLLLEQRPILHRRCGRSSRLGAQGVLDTGLDTTSKGEEQAYSSAEAAERLFLTARTAGAGAEGAVRESQLAGAALLEGARRMGARDEAWRYSSLRTLLEPAYLPVQALDARPVSAEELAMLREPGCLCAVLLDGVFRADLSQLGGLDAEEGLSVRSFRDMAQGELSAQLQHVPDAQELARDSFGSDSLAALNMASATDGLLVAVAQGCRIAKPLHVLSLLSGGPAPRLVSPRLAVVLATNATLVLKQSAASLASEGAPAPWLVVAGSRVLLAEGALLEHSYVQEVAGEVRHLEVLSAEVAADALYQLTALQMGGRLGRLNAHINLKAPLANCSLNAVTLAHTRQSLDLHSSIVHAARDTRSRQTMRNVVGDRGEAIFKGRIRIPSAAKGADSDQQCRSLMLGDKARVVVMPTLEISADDVTCSHGAAVCDLDENSMFYLSSRGINRVEARKLLLRSFVLEFSDDRVTGPAALRRVIDKVETMGPAIDLQRGSRSMESL